MASSIFTTPEAVARSIGDIFGPYIQENGKHILDYCGTRYEYNTAADLLRDWLETIRQQHIDENGAPGANWEAEIKYIENLK